MIGSCARWISLKATFSGPAAFNYTYDRNGNRIQQVETRTDPATQALKAAETTLYGYDTLDRLTGVAYPDHSVLYRLDAVGNRTAERQTTDVLAALGPSAFAAATHLTHDVTATFDASDWLISRTDALDATKSASFGYDPNGNLTSKTTAATTRTFLWDARNTLTVVRDNGGQVGNYDYRWDGLRVKRSAQSQQVEYVLDDKFVLAEGDGSVASHATKRRYHYAAQPLAESEVSGASRFTTWLDTDAQGSVTDATQADGTLRTERQYDAWGNYRNSTAPSTTDPKLGYTGHQFDPETGLVYARARYYDSELGIFLSRDPKEPTLGDAPRLHRYVYVKGNPGRYIDIDGEWDAPSDWADSWQRSRQESGLPSGEEVMARYTADVERRVGEMLDEDFLQGGSSEARSAIGALHATATGTLLESTVGFLSAVGTDPGMFVRSILRFGTQTASGVEDIRHGRLESGWPKIIGEAGSGVLMVTGGEQILRAVPIEISTRAPSTELSTHPKVTESTPMAQPDAVRPASQQPIGGNGIVLKTGEGATPTEMAASGGGPTANSRKRQPVVRQQLIDEAIESAETPRCWRCGNDIYNVDDAHLGHRNVPRSKGGNLERANVCLEGAACNLSTGSGEAPTPGMSCAERGGCGAPYGRFDADYLGSDNSPPDSAPTHLEPPR